MSEPRAAVIGYGNAGRYFHSYLIDITPGLALHGVSSSRPETYPLIVEERGCKAYPSFEAVIADPEVDLVVLATPNSTHADLAIRAMEAGKHVVTDKIMCLDLAECDRMMESAQRTGMLLNVFQNRRWDGDYLTVQHLMQEGKLGDVRWLELSWQRMDPPKGWRAQADMGGGRFLDLGAHLVDQLLLLAGAKPEGVYCRLHYDFTDSDVESHAFIVVHFANGVTGVCDMSSMASILKPRFHVYGTQATFVKYGLDPQEAFMKARDIDASREEEALYGRLHDGQQEEIIPTVPGRWRSYYENIRDVLTDGAEPAVKLPENRQVMAVIDAARRSAQTGQVVQI